MKTSTSSGPTVPAGPPPPGQPPAGPTVAPAPAGRARPLPPDQRRAALIVAAIPLVARYGTKVTSRQIAEAAGVAEGTIFRVFTDKDELIRATVKAVFDPAPTLAELSGVDPTLPLQERLIAVTTILQKRLIGVFDLVIAMGWQSPPEGVERQRGPDGPSSEMIFKAITGLLMPDRDAFRCPVEEVVRVLRLLVFSGTHPRITEGNPLTAHQIASVVLDGVRQHHA